MRVLHLTPELPCWPGGSGGATRQFHLLRRLVELGHDVTVVAPVPHGDEARRASLAQAGIKLLGPARPRSRVAETLSALRQEPRLVPAASRRPLTAWQVSVFFTSLRPYLHEALEVGMPEVITIEHDHAAHWLDDLPAAVPAVLTLQNVGWRYAESRAASSRGLSQAWFRIEAWRFLRYDRRWLARYPLLVAVSERDRDALEQEIGGAVALVPNGVASDELVPQPPSEEPATLLFTGTLNHPPNAEGIRWFADSAWPLVRSRRPDARLLVVGRHPPPAVVALSERDGIEVVGPVPAMAPWFRRATAVVAPLRSGGGTRLKILEALACGRAVVSTTVGCEGLELRDDFELLIADRPEAFATAALRLIEDPATRDRLAASGRAKVERQYDWRILGDRLEGALAALTRPT